MNAVPALEGVVHQAQSLGKSILPTLKSFLIHLVSYRVLALSPVSNDSFGSMLVEQ